MKTKLLSLFLAFTSTLAFAAKNTVQKVEQVGSSVTLRDNVDYVITGSTPFSATGSINIANTDHAVVILENIRPSKALEQLEFISINGVPAVNDENCQVKMYAQGSIIMPYSKDIKPLTVYSEQNFEGESVNDFGLEHASGYMNTLSEAKLNNRIRSFKLKRGYMVTFSNNRGGRGYSRCFIADDQDLEFATLPAVLDKHISSYRIFKWNDTEKKGIANTTDYTTTQTLNVSWCYSFGPGEDRGIDCECVPHKIQVGWPGNCGALTYSPHLKTNNEPGNESDHGVESLESVLATWEDLMATGKRLCSPSSHDGSLSWMYNFMDSIEARGWRCDIIDLHCYWPEWNLNNQLKGWYDRYKRPLWISEFIWGSSWGPNGIFSAVSKDEWDSYSLANQQKNYDVMNKVLTNWNNYPYVERYAYWNSERNCSKILHEGQLSLLGEFYANMKSGIGYNKAYEYVPTVVYKGPQNFTCTYTQRLKTIDLAWSNPNMELTDSTLLEFRIDDEPWQTIEKYPATESSSFTYTVTLSDNFRKGTYTYRIHNFDCDGQERISEEASITLSGAEGVPGFQYGRMEIANTETSTGFFDQLEDGSSPLVFMGLTTRNNKNAALTNHIVSVSSNKFTFKYEPWGFGGYTDMTESESNDFMVLSKGTHQYDNIRLEVAETESRIGNQEVWIDFQTPFPEGVTPVVITSMITRSIVYPYSIKVWGITNEGFFVKLARQVEADNTAPSFTSQKIAYVAATPGTVYMGGEKTLTIGTSSDLVGASASAARTIKFNDGADGVYRLYNPYTLCGPQTDNLDCASIYRINSYETEEITQEDNTLEVATGIRIFRQKDNTATGVTDLFTTRDMMGWIIVSDTYSPDGIAEVTQPGFHVYVENRQIKVEGTSAYAVYSIDGQKMAKNASLPNGIYIVKAGNQVIKVSVRP